MKEYILEACVDSVESAMAAVEGGADRLELCGNLIIGGTTPGPWLFDEIRKRSDIRIHALIRPRFGDFCYTDAEFSLIKHAVEDFRKMGAEGVVFGVLRPDGTLNMEQMKELIRRTTTPNAKEHARRLMERVYLLQKLQAHDDMTILIGKLWKKG